MSVAKYFSFAVLAATAIVTNASAQDFVRPINPGGYNHGGYNQYPQPQQQYPQYPQQQYPQQQFPNQGGYRPNYPQYPNQYPNQPVRPNFPQQPGHPHPGFPGQRPPIVQPPIVRPPIGIPQGPQSYQLNGFANREGNQSGFHRIKLDIDRTGPNTFHVDGYLRYANGAQVRVHADAVGNINRGTICIDLGRIGKIDLHPVGRGELRGEVRLFGALDGNGMAFEIDRD